MTALRLAATGWVAKKPSTTGYIDDDPMGNRLRWSWPEDAASDGQHVVPKTILVERAPWEGDVDLEAYLHWGSATIIPAWAWDELDQSQVDLINKPGLTPVTFDPSTLAGHPVQAIQFTYGGAYQPVLVQAFQGTRCVAARMVSVGKQVTLQASRIDRVSIWVPSCVLTKVKTLNLYRPAPLEFARIATIDVDATSSATFAEVASRYPPKSTLAATPDRWAGGPQEFGLQPLWNKAKAEPVGAEGLNGGPNAWRELQIALATRWEFAVLCGLGGVDGPANVGSLIDEWYADLDVGVPIGPATEHDRMAYRVLDADGVLAPSNVVYLPGAIVPDLSEMNPPRIENGRVWLDRGLYKQPATPRIRAAWDLVWSSKAEDAAIVGAVVTEALTVGGVTSDEMYDARGRRENDPPGSGIVHREEVHEGPVSPQMKVAALVAAEDGFDRVGLVSQLSPATDLAIDHHPQPPVFGGAVHSGTTAALTQLSPDWVPDPMVVGGAGKVRIYRRKPVPLARREAQILGWLPNGDLLAVRLSIQPAELQAFSGGSMAVGPVRGTILLVFADWALVDLPHGNGAMPVLPDNMPAVLAQSPTFPGLFDKVYERPATGFPSTISFPDALPTTGKAQLIEYRAQVHFAGQSGPLGPAVQALLLPPKPKELQPFTVKTLGVDAYRRTLVQLDLSKKTTERLDVWWANGSVLLGDFIERAVPGDVGPQIAEGGLHLFDTLSLPIPGKVARTVTIGVQAVNAAGGRGDFMKVLHPLPAKV
jgi:hypothetical protein